MELIAADTVLLNVLIYLWNSLMGEISLKYEDTKMHKVTEHDTRNITDWIKDVRKYLRLVLGSSGCDTTSTVYGKVEPLTLKLLEIFKAAKEETAFLQRYRAQKICENET